MIRYENKTANQSFDPTRPNPTNDRVMCPSGKNARQIKNEKRLDKGVLTEKKGKAHGDKSKAADNQTWLGTQSLPGKAVPPERKC